jgi:microcystin-dependent protein
MASTYSPSLKLELIGNGDQSGTWGTTTNNNLGTLLEQAITGVQNITMLNADYVLTNYNGTSDEARNAVLVVGGTNSAIRQIIAPLVNKLYVVTNNTSGGYAITVGGVSGSTVTIPNGITAQVYCNGTNFYSAQTGSAGNFTVNGTLTATGLTDTGNMNVGGTLGVTGTTTFTGIPSGPTATAGTNTTQLATTAFVQTALASAAITGTINMWPTASAPTGYLLCTGTAVSRTTYAALYAVIGTTFGVGDGSTTFNLPDYTNRMPYGTTVGATGGSADAIVVSHTHTATVTDPGHFHNTNYNFATYAGGGSSGPNNTFGSVNNPQTDTKTTGISVANSTAGASGTNANLPPYLGINFIIKT